MQEFINIIIVILIFGFLLCTALFGAFCHSGGEEAGIFGIVFGFLSGVAVWFLFEMWKRGLLIL